MFSTKVNLIDVCEMRRRDKSELIEGQGRGEGGVSEILVCIRCNHM